MQLIIPDSYRNLLGSVENTEKAIKAVKDMFQNNLSAQLALLRASTTNSTEWSAPSISPSRIWASAAPRSCTPSPSGRG